MKAILMFRILGLVSFLFFFILSILELGTIDSRASFLLLALILFVKADATELKEEFEALEKRLEKSEP